MNKIQSWLEKYMLPVASKIQGNQYVGAVSDGFSRILPIIMIGAIFTLITSLQLGGYQDFITNTGIKTIFGYASGVTTDLLALYTVAAVAYSLTLRKGLDNDAIMVAFLSIFVLLILTPLGVSGTTESGETLTIGAAIPTGFLGAKGLFSAIIIGLLVPAVYAPFIEKHIVIKLPDAVPPTISKSFSALIPGFVIAIVFSLVRFGFAQTTYGSFNAFIYAIIATPLNALGRNPLSVVLFILVCQILWFFGLHGFLVILPFVQAVFLPLSLENLTAYEAMAELPNQIVYQHFGTYVLIGGSGAVLGLTIIMAFFAKSNRYKTLGRLALPSVICGINEPIIFGMPMVLNPVMLIPFILSPLLSFLVPYLAQVLLSFPTLRGISMPLGTPVLLYGFLEGGIPVMLMQVLVVVIQAVVYFPFFKMLDNAAVKEEEEPAEENA